MEAVVKTRLLPLCFKMAWAAATNKGVPIVAATKAEAATLTSSSSSSRILLADGRADVLEREGSTRLRALKLGGGAVLEVTLFLRRVLTGGGAWGKIVSTMARQSN
jgi:hypothetical protein